MESSLNKDPELFKNNITRWALFHPIQAASLLNIKSERVTFSQNEQNLRMAINDALYEAHSHTDPLGEAISQFNQLNLKNIDVIYYLGVGLGYFYDAAKEWLHGDPRHQLVFLEQDLDVIHHFLQTQRAKDVLFDPQAWLTYIDPQGKELDPTAGYFIGLRSTFVTLPVYGMVYEDYARGINSRLEYSTQYLLRNMSEMGDYGRRFYSNYYNNISQLPGASFGNRLFGAFKGIPAIICGAGPSLAKQLPLLKNLKEQAVIFAGGTAMNALNTAGILPHFGVGIDPNPAQLTRLIMNQAYEVPYFYRNRMYDKALKSIHGPHLFISGSSGYRVYEYFESKLGIEGIFLQEGYNVINFSLSIAHAMGCDPIVFVGLDLAYTDMLSYCPGILNHPLHDRREHFGTKTPDEELINKMDYKGIPTLTLWKWISESAWFSNFARTHPDTAYYNATEGGIGFAGIIDAPLEELAKSRLLKQYDIAARIHGAISEANFPTDIDENTLISIMQELRDGLIRCRKILEEKEFLELLKNEMAFKYVLQDFNQAFEDIHKRQMFRLAVDSQVLGKAEFKAKHDDLEGGRRRFLTEAIEANLYILEHALSKLGRRYVTPLSSMHEKSIKKIAEPIKIPEKPIDVELCQEFYPSGELKLEQYRRQAVLEGPSILYAKNGEPISIHYFEQGVQVGEAREYYIDGTLAYKGHFSAGNLDGLQEYYYPDGSIKTILNYLKGKLHGVVQLYYPSGQLKRELNFADGKRCGKDRLWNELGGIEIEADFDQDRPVGVSREWYENGNMAKEVTFDQETSSYTVKEWWENGDVKETYGGTRGDYFDAVSLQTQKLTQSIDVISNQLLAIVPVIDEISKEKGKLEKELYASLKDEMAHLEQINRKLLVEAGLAGDSDEESIWKTPQMRSEVEEHIEKLSVMMTKEMQKIQGSLMETLEKLSNKLDHTEKHDE